MIRKRVLMWMLPFVLALLASTSQSPAQSLVPPAGCHDTVGGGATDDGFSNYSGKECVREVGAVGAHSGTPGPPVRVLDCGPPRLRGHVLSTGSPDCTEVQNLCAVATQAKLPTDQHITTQAVLTQRPDGSWRLTGWNCALRTATPHLTPLLVREQIERLVPHPAIGVAPPDGTTLVNIQTLLWLDTKAERSLGTVTLLGHQVSLRVTVNSVDWNFGDDTTDTTLGPGRPYDTDDGCNTAVCSGYFGHFYRQTGQRTITASVTWDGRYAVDGGAWQAIFTPVTAPATTTQVAVKEARGVLVPNPGDR